MLKLNNSITHFNLKVMDGAKYIKIINAIKHHNLLTNLTLDFEVCILYQFNLIKFRVR